MRVLLITTGLALGGAERQVADLADRLVTRGHTVAIAYLVGNAEIRPAPDVTLYPLHFRKTFYGILSGCLQLRRLIRRWHPDVVHSHMVHANLIARTLRLITPMRRLICTAHNTTEGGTYVRLAYRLTDCLATISTNVSSEAVQAFEQAGAVPKGRMIPVHNGIDLQLFSSSPTLKAQSREALFPRPGAQLLLSVGRLVEQKNHAGLLRAFAQIAPQFPEVELWIAGSGPLREALLRQRAELGLDGKIMFLGTRSDVPDLMRAADVFVLSSWFEGFGLVVAEAMASGTPVVANDAGGVAEVMNGTGFLIPVGDDTALACGMIDALSMASDQKSNMISAARSQVEACLNIDHIVDTWVALYEGKLAC